MKIENKQLRNYNRKVLLVEDSTVNQLVTKRYLGNLGLDVYVAENGQIAIDILKEKQVHLVLMDLEMPILGGIAASKIIRAESISMVPIIALTAHNDPGIRRLCKETKMNGYIIKPVKIENLIKELDKFFS